MLHRDDDGEQIRRGRRMGTLVISHDPSYMPDKLKVVSGAGILIFCKAIGKSLSRGLAEKSNNTVIVVRDNCAVG